MHQDFLEIVRSPFIVDDETLHVFWTQIFGDFLTANFANFANSAKFARKFRTKATANSAGICANSGISRLAVYNTYIPQTGNYEFAPSEVLISKFAKNLL